MKDLSRKYLVIGSEGGLGNSVTAAMETSKHSFTGLDLPEVDLKVNGTLRPMIETKWLESGPFDGLVFAAGMFPAILADETSEDQFDELMVVNARSALIAITTMARLTVADSRQCSVVVISSTAAARARTGTTAYAASKAALEAIVRGVALENCSRGFRVNAVAPGFVDGSSPLNAVPRDYVAALSTASPHGRVAIPQDITPAIMWLLSAESHWVTGQTLVVDGGTSLGSQNAPNWLK
ncbi:NAD(P)-dependent dehydrogenase, short-chain alcohol dehydrogenase family [Arthrobacter sp. UNCCL28]|uniref:SDR family NAD(P)-dependent oxidoreductase n=1 Tax=Arthrobacter sp. UNCCL28 TaxID=1502752 RepID=UPI00087652C8|nr:NAD(P)-dependent dehydrogenase, short-chain alcohol dehydrogenase family [Arthrobacter sp. UNCCL28]